MKSPKYAQLRNSELRTVKPWTSPAHTHSRWAFGSVAIASWKSTPSNVMFCELGDEPICTGAAFVTGP